MTALARTKAEPDDPIRGVINDFADVFGLPRAEDILGTPADWATKMGVPLPREVIPTPADALDAGIKGMRTGRMPSLPRPPTMPMLPNPADTFPAPVPGDVATMFRQPPLFGQGGYYQQETAKREPVRRR